MMCDQLAWPDNIDPVGWPRYLAGRRAVLGIFGA
jgi:hypothetical protein